MNLRTAQDQKYIEKGWWEWSVWIEGPNNELDEVEEVTYKLHRTFTNPVRTEAGCRPPHRKRHT